MTVGTRRLVENIKKSKESPPDRVKSLVEEFVHFSSSNSSIKIFLKKVINLEDQYHVEMTNNYIHELMTKKPDMEFFSDGLTVRNKVNFFFFSFFNLLVPGKAM